MDKAAGMMGMRHAGPKIRKELVKKLVVFQVLGVNGFDLAPANVNLRLKVRVLTAKVGAKVPHIEDPRKFPPQTVSIWTFDPTEDVAHLFVQYKNKLKCVRDFRECVRVFVCSGWSKLVCRAR